MSPQFQLKPEVKIYTVTELTSEIKSILEPNLNNIWVSGEISNLKDKYITGHIYFSLKDENAIISCLIFKNIVARIKFKLQDGLKVLIFGSISIWEKSGTYRLLVEDIIPEGKGKLQLAFEQLKEKLAKEGLFDKARKKPIPIFPERIGIITSPGGAAIRDILNIINRRSPQLHIIIFPATVQGERAVYDIVEGIEVFNRLNNVDVIILARGGGSLEDLWAFNEEPVARSIYNSKIPIISAIGHEIDYTISDFVADLRAETPSAAAEIISSKKIEVENKIKTAENRILKSIRYLLDSYKQRFDNCSAEKLKIYLKNLIKQYKISLTSVSEKLQFIYSQYFNSLKQRHKILEEKLLLLSPLAVLNKGYSITYKMPEKIIIKSAEEVKPSDEILVKLSNGELLCVVKKLLNVPKN